MRAAVFTFVKPSETATMFSHVIARFVSERTGLPLFWSDEVAKLDLDVLVIVAGGMPFCGHLAALGKAVGRAGRVILVSNDYHSKFPDHTTEAKSPFRAAFRLRHKRGLPPPDHWSTMAERAALTERGAVIMWNKLAWTGEGGWKMSAPASLLYYGSWRRERVKKFDQYFSRPAVRTVISNNSGRFAERYPKCRHVESNRQTLQTLLCSHGMGLYLQDPKSVAMREPPACRFYEMLSAEMPMLFDEDCVQPMLSHGYSVSRYVVREPRDIRSFMKFRVDVSHEQYNLWIQFYRKQIEREFDEAWGGYR